MGLELMQQAAGIGQTSLQPALARFGLPVDQRGFTRGQQQGARAGGLQPAKAARHRVWINPAALLPKHGGLAKALASLADDASALFGVDCHSGDTFTDGEVAISMTDIHVPDAVIHYTINADSKYSQNLSKALQRFSKEDPTFRVASDPETGETIISGIRSGELKLAEGEEELSLKPCGLMRFEVKATERSDRNKLTLRLSWSTDQEPPPGSDSLSISAG